MLEPLFICNYYCVLVTCTCNAFFSKNFQDQLECQRHLMVLADIWTRKPSLVTWCWCGVRGVVLQWLCLTAHHTATSEGEKDQDDSEHVNLVSSSGHQAVIYLTSSLHPPGNISEPGHFPSPSESATHPRMEYSILIFWLLWNMIRSDPIIKSKLAIW